MQFGIMLERGTNDAVFVLGRLLREYGAKGKKLCICFVKQENVFDKVLRKVFEWEMRK